MKYQALAILFAASILLLPVGQSMAADSRDNCIVLVEASEALLNRYSRQLHALVDLLPEDIKFGLEILDRGAQFSVPRPLELSRRAEMHAYLQSESWLPVSSERDWLRSVSKAADQLAAVNGTRTLVVIREQWGNADDWLELAKLLAARQIKVIYLSLEANPIFHPLVLVTGGEQHLLTDSFHALLLESLGVRAANLTGQVISDMGRASYFSVDPEVKTVAIFLEHARLGNMQLVTPHGVSLGLEEAGKFGTMLNGPGYTCIRLQRSLVLPFGGWAGEWVISSPLEGMISIWLDDPTELVAEVIEIDGRRLVTAHLSRSGKRIDPSGVGLAGITMVNQRGHYLGWLNDLGLNGDDVPGDGIFSGVMQSYSFPLAGKGLLVASGHVDRLAHLEVPESSGRHISTRPSRGYLSKATSAGCLLVGLLGTALTLRPRRPVWRIRHSPLYGDERTFLLAERGICLVGSDRSCSVRLSAQANRRQFRLRVLADETLLLELLSKGQQVTVGGEPVFLCRQLSHGDVIIANDEHILVEKMSRLRVGQVRRIGY